MEPNQRPQAVYRADLLRESRAMAHNGSTRRVFWGLLVVLLVALALAKLFVFELVTVQGNDMAPQIQPGDVLLASRLGHRPNPGDLVLFERPDTRRLLVRRVLALPGETFALRNEVPVVGGKAWRREVRGTVRLRAVDGSPTRAAIMVEERRPGGHHLLLKDPSRRSKDISTTRLGDAYYVLSDDRNHGADSRDFGPVPRQAVRAVICLRLVAGDGSVEPQIHHENFDWLP